MLRGKHVLFKTIKLDLSPVHFIVSYTSGVFFEKRKMTRTFLERKDEQWEETAPEGRNVLLANDLELPACGDNNE